jgi:hypothetical protein
MFPKQFMNFFGKVDNVLKVVKFVVSAVEAVRDTFANHSAPPLPEASQN